jgi:hypothetical protein
MEHAKSALWRYEGEKNERAVRVRHLVISHVKTKKKKTCRHTWGGRHHASTFIHAAHALTSTVHHTGERTCTMHKAWT